MFLIINIADVEWLGSVLSKHGQYLADTLMCPVIGEQVNDIEPAKSAIVDIETYINVTRQYNKKVVPNVCLGRDVFRFSDSKGFRYYRDYLYGNIDRLGGVLIGTYGFESGNWLVWNKAMNYSTLLREHQSESINVAYEEMAAMRKIMPKVFESGKAVVMPCEVPLEREAFLFKDDLGKALYRNLIIENNVMVVPARGAWCISHNRGHHQHTYVKYGNNWSPLWAHWHPNAGEWPFGYYKEYISAINAWSGIGYPDGAASHNMLKLIDAGYKGAWAWASRDETVLGKLLTDTTYE